MFETAGTPTILDPVYTLVGLVALPLVAALIAVFVKGRIAAVVSALASLGVLGLAVANATRLTSLPAKHILAQHVAQIVRVGQLDLALDLDMDGGSASFVVLVAVLGLAAILHAAWTKQPGAPLPRISSASLEPPSSRSSLSDLAPPSSSPSLPELEPEALLDDDDAKRDDLPARLAWIQLLAASAILVAIADAWPIVAAGLATSTIAAWGLARGASSRALVAALAGDACVLFGACFLFWSLGGVFTTTGYAPDTMPRFALVQATNEIAPEGKATISLTSYAGAQLVADDGPPLPGEPLRAPFSVTVEPGTTSLRILSGVASQDALVSHVTLAPGKAYVLVPFGPTSSLRNLHDQLEVPRPSLIAGSPPVRLRATMKDRTVFGIRVAVVFAALVLIGLLLRLALTAHRGDGRDGAAPPLEVLPTVFVALRLATFTPPGTTTTMMFAIVSALAAIILAATASAATDPRAALRGVVAAAGAIGVTAALAGDAGGAFVIASSAALGSAAALSALDAGGDVRWLGVACAATAGILPAAGSSSGFAGAIAAALASSAETVLIGIVCFLMVAAMALVALASLRVYDASIRRRPTASPGKGPRALAAILAALALVTGVVLGVGTSHFGGKADPLVQRLVPGSLKFVGIPRHAAAALGAAIAAAAFGVLAARISSSVTSARWATLFSGPARGTSAAAGVFGRFFDFLGRSVLALDREVVDDATDIVAHTFLRAGAGIRRAGSASAKPGKKLDDAATAALARAGLDDPRSAERLRTGILIGMMALLALVVLSSLVFG